MPRPWARDTSRALWDHNWDKYGNVSGSGEPYQAWRLQPADYIWPFRPATNYSVLNAEMFQWPLFWPLYMFGSNGTFILYADPRTGS